jgi:hypothetical protein
VSNNTLHTLRTEPLAVITFAVITVQMFLYKAYKHTGGAEVQLHSFFSYVLGGDESSASHPDCFTSREISAGAHCIEYWVGPRADLDISAKKNLRCVS